MKINQPKLDVIVLFAYTKQCNCPGSQIFMRGVVSKKRKLVGVVPACLWCCKYWSYTPQKYTKLYKEKLEAQINEESKNDPIYDLDSNGFTDNCGVIPIWN